VSKKKLLSRNEQQSFVWVFKDHTGPNTTRLKGSKCESLHGDILEMQGQGTGQGRNGEAAWGTGIFGAMAEASMQNVLQTQTSVHSIERTFFHLLQLKQPS
jgi:hypothetical protein